MNILNELPPNYVTLCEVFPSIVNEPDAIFSYYPHIYCPSGKDLPSYKIAHEEVHGAQQGEIGVEWWWQTYITDKQFRFNEEAIAYQADYKEFCRLHKDKNERLRYLRSIAQDLGSPMYGDFGKSVAMSSLMAIITKNLPVIAIHL